MKKWIMMVNADKSYIISSKGYRWHNGKESALIQATSYDSNGRVKDMVKESYIEWEGVIPGSSGEAIWDYVNSQARRL